MPSKHPVQALAAVFRAFGAGPARDKKRLLDELTHQERLGAKDLLLLHDTLCFMRAYPDDRQILDRLRKLEGRMRGWLSTVRGGANSTVLQDTGFPGSVNNYCYSYGVLLRLVQAFPGCADIDWDELEDESALHNALVLVVTNGECQGLDDIHLTFPSWIESCQGQPRISDLEFVLQIFEGSHLSLQEKSYIFESAALPIRYRLDRPGTGRCETWWPQQRIHYQKQAIDRQRVPLAGEITRPFDSVKLVDSATGEALIQVSLAALCGRNLEISSLVHANAHDVTLLHCDRGVQIVLIGVVPEFRDALESTYFCLILKNGVPIAYGPASPCLGCCEMGLNLFPEFRAGEINFLYSQFMRSLYQVLGVRYFYLTAYGMGQGNPEAIRTGAFWFYRKLGFAASNPVVESLALQEEERMREQPGYRSSTRTLHNLSDTDAHLDMSRGACRRLDLGTVGIRQSQFIAEEFQGNRLLAVEHCVRRVARALGSEDHGRWPAARQRALKILAPTLCMIPGFTAWSQKDKDAMLRIIRSKGDRSEAKVDVLASRHRLWRQGLLMGLGKEAGR